MSGSSTGTNVNNSDQVLGDTWTWNGANSTWAQACTSCTVTPPPAIGAAIAYHRANVEDLLYGGVQRHRISGGAVHHLDLDRELAAG